MNAPVTLGDYDTEGLDGGRSVASQKREMTDNPIVLRIVDLLKEQGKKDKELMDFLGTPQSLIAKWKYQGNTVYLKYIAEIAEFLNTTPNYLFPGVKELHHVEGLTPMENEVIRMFRCVDERRKKCIRGTLKCFIEGSEIEAGENENDVEDENIEKPLK